MDWAITGAFGHFYFDKRVPDSARNAVLQLIAKETGTPVLPPPDSLFGLFDPFVDESRRKTRVDVQKSHPAIYSPFSDRVDFGTKSTRAKKAGQQLELDNR